MGPDADAAGELGRELTGQRGGQGPLRDRGDWEDGDLVAVAAQNPQEHLFVFLQR